MYETYFTWMLVLKARWVLQVKIRDLGSAKTGQGDDYVFFNEKIYYLLK